MTLRRWRTALGALAAFATAFAARADDPSAFLSPSRGESLAPGAIVEVRWASACAREGRADEAEIVLSLDGGLTFPVRVSHEMSPCATRYLWRVPALASGRARLALRTGSEGLGRTERITAVSGDFRILSDLDGRVQELYRRAAEWWTPPEATILTAEDLFGGALSSSDGRILTPFAATEIGAPPSHALTCQPGPRSGRPADSVRTELRVERASSRPVVAAPLRL